MNADKLNADEAVKKIREAVDKRANNKGYARYMSRLIIWELAWQAADLIESLQAQLAASERRELAALKKLSVESGGGDECDDE